MRARDEKSSGLVKAALLAVLVSLVGVAGAVKIAQSTIAKGPSVGDILQFRPTAYMAVDPSTKLAATRGGSGECTFDMDVVHGDGGSLIIEQRLVAGTEPRYVAHWAGKRTAHGAADCGREADVVLDNASLLVLAMAAGGWTTPPRQPTERSSFWDDDVPARHGRHW